MRLFAAVGRPNVMIKVPATAAGVRALQRLIRAGINVNVTLMFSMKHYEVVAEAYLAGLSAFMEAGGNLGQVASVASFFVSRVDTAVDRALERVGTPESLRLRGQAAIANCRRV